MTKQEFIKKYSSNISNHSEDDFIEDVSSLFQTRSAEEVRENLELRQYQLNKYMESDQNMMSQMHHKAMRDLETEISLLKWFLKE